MLDNLKVEAEICSNSKFNVATSCFMLLQKYIISFSHLNLRRLISQEYVKFDNFRTHSTHLRE